MNVNHLAAVITCVDYGDFLEECLHHNLPHFQDCVVVTSFEDRHTPAVCARHNVECVKTDLFTRRGKPFSKGSGINLGIAHLNAEDWILHIDADICLPRNYRHSLEREHIDRRCIYGADRMDVPGSEAWDRHLKKRHVQHTNTYFVDPPAEFRLSGRIVHREWGYVPIGFHQLWHKSQGNRYPENTPNAERTDMLFALRWSHEHRRKLNGVVVYHLMSEPHARMGANWNGRRTQPFRPGSKPHHDTRTY